ncbi:MAG: hypothetical protein WDO18_11290 [Acidobacteriota bacterium]
MFEYRLSFNDDIDEGMDFEEDPGMNLDDDIGDYDDDDDEVVVVRETIVISTPVSAPEPDATLIVLEAVEDEPAPARKPAAKAAAPAKKAPAKKVPAPAPAVKAPAAKAPAKKVPAKKAPAKKAPAKKVPAKKKVVAEEGTRQKGSGQKSTCQKSGEEGREEGSSQEGSAKKAPAKKVRQKRSGARPLPHFLNYLLTASYSGRRARNSASTCSSVLFGPLPLKPAPPLDLPSPVVPAMKRISSKATSSLLEPAAGRGVKVFFVRHIISKVLDSCRCTRVTTSHARGRAPPHP